MAERSFPYNYEPTLENEYDQEELTAMLGEGTGDGVSYKTYGEDSLKISVPNFGTVTVAPGILRARGYIYENSEPLNIPIPGYTSGQPRADRVVIRFNTAAGSTSAHAVIKDGTDGNKEPPALTDSGNLFEKSLGQIVYDGVSTTLIPIDERDDPELCGTYRSEATERLHIPRLIGNAEFDGTKDISVEDMGITPEGIGALPDTTAPADIGALPVGTTAADIGALPAPHGTAPGPIANLQPSIPQGYTGEDRLVLTWFNPTDDGNWYETVVVESNVGYPRSVDDGRTLHRSRMGTSVSVIDVNGQAGITYYYSIFTLNETGMYDPDNKVTFLYQFPGVPKGPRTLWTGDLVVGGTAIIPDDFTKYRLFEISLSGAGTRVLAFLVPGTGNPEYYFRGSGGNAGASASGTAYTTNISATINGSTLTLLNALEVSHPTSGGHAYTAKNVTEIIGLL